MYVLSNQYGAWGVSTILYPGVLRKAAKKLGGDLLILPSSIHEVILVRHENMGEYDKIAGLVKEINQREVLPEDVISDSVYLYEEKDGSFCHIAGNRGKDAGCMQHTAMTGLQNLVWFCIDFVEQICYTLSI